MAEENGKKTPKKAETVRERAERAIAEASKTAKRAPNKGPTSETDTKKRRLARRAKKQDQQSKRRFHLFPRFFKLAWQELRQVTWPDRRNTLKLTSAVILFSLIFSALVSVVDYGLGIVFKKVFLHG